MKMGEYDKVNDFLLRVGTEEVHYYLSMKGRLYARRHGSSYFILLQIDRSDLPSDVDKARELLETEFAIAIMRGGER